jgi:hypothetical protein
MRIARRTLVPIVVLAVTLLIAALAAAAAPDFCNPESEDYKPSHPSCTTTTTTDPTTTTTTTEAGPPDAMPGLSFAELSIYDPDHDVPWIEWRPEYDPILGEWVDQELEITMTPESTVLHVDLWNSTPGTVTVTVTDPGRAGSVGANLRDSHPGDHCLMVQEIDMKKGQSVMTLPGADDSVGVIPPATTNACGTEWSESDIDEDGEVVFTTDLQTGTPDPLAMALWYGKGPATTVKVTLSFEPEESQP